MVDSRYDDVVGRCADLVGDVATMQLVRQLLERLRLPGPVVTIVGAEGRGKTAVLSLLSGHEFAATRYVQFAGIPSWRGAISRWPASQWSFHSTASPDAQTLLLCDAPSGVIPGGAQERLLDVSDLVIMVVQASQPSGIDEVEFARRHFLFVPSVLVLSKCDMLPPSDLLDAADEAEEAFGDIPWIELLLSSKGKAPLDGGTHWQRLSEWWPVSGSFMADQARQRRLEDMERSLIALVDSFIDTQTGALEDELGRIRASRLQSKKLQEAKKGTADITLLLSDLRKSADSAFTQQLRTLRRALDETKFTFDEDVRRGKLPTPLDVQERLVAALRDWGERASADVAETLKEKIDTLNRRIQDYQDKVASLYSAIDHTGYDPHVVIDLSGPDAHGPPEAGHVRLVDVPEKTAGEHIRSALNPVLSGSVAGTVIGTLAISVAAPVVAIPLAVVAMLAAGFASSDAVRQAAHRRIANDLQGQINRWSSQQEQHIHSRFRLTWLDYTQQIASALSPINNALRLVDAQVTASAPAETASRERQIVEQLGLLNELQRDIGWVAANGLSRRDGTEGPFDG